MDPSSVSLIRKHEFPSSVKEALHLLRHECEKLKSGVPSSQELTILLELVDEYIFWHPRLQQSKHQPTIVGSNGAKWRRPTSIQQLQIIYSITEYFGANSDVSLFCSMFMIVFMVKGRDVEFKIATLAKLLSISLGVGNMSLLNCIGMWMAQQNPTSEASLQVVSYLVNDHLSLLPNQNNNDLKVESLSYLPTKSPLLSANLLVAFGKLYNFQQPTSSGVSSGSSLTAVKYVPPPIQVVRLAKSWLKTNPELGGGQGQTPEQGVVPMTGVTPVSTLIVWPIMAPLVSGNAHSVVYSELHLTLIESLQESNSNQRNPTISLKSMTQLTGSLMSVLSGTSKHHSDSTIQTCLDRYGQILEAVLTSAGIKAEVTPDSDLVTLINQLPHNRLLQIVIHSLS